MDSRDDFKIRGYRGHFILYNCKADKEHHTHIYSKKTCERLIDWICRKIVPDSGYLRESAKRISRDEKYIEKICIKVEKDSQKPKFHKVNNGRF